MEKQRLLALIASSKDLRLLYVEDDIEVRTMTARLFARFFKDMTICTNGEEGLAAFQNSDFDLIITDINMPIMDGIEMIENIRLEDTMTPILVFSGQNRPKELEHEVNGYIVKPMKHLKFLSLLEHTVRYILLKKRLGSQHQTRQGVFQEDTRYTGTYL